METGQRPTSRNTGQAWEARSYLWETRDGPYQIFVSSTVCEGSRRPACSRRQNRDDLGSLQHEDTRGSFSCVVSVLPFPLNPNHHKLISRSDEIAGHKWWGHYLAAAIFPMTPLQGGCVVDSAFPVNRLPPRELTLEFEVKVEGMFPRSRPKADVPQVQSPEKDPLPIDKVVKVRDRVQGPPNDPQPLKRVVKVQDQRAVQRRRVSTMRHPAASCPPLNRLPDRCGPPPPYTSPRKLESEHRERKSRKEVRCNVSGHKHQPVPKITVQDHSGTPVRHVYNASLLTEAS
ncbi:MAG: hypothetical protein Q9169_003647 [Polycauliona sp. 2 TL-2023]